VNKVEIGKKGEINTAEYLKRYGWKILDRNFRFHKKEVDIIARKDDLVIFVEVKTRSGVEFGRGFEAVNRYKKENILQVAKYYIEKNNLKGCNIRFDVVSIEKDRIYYIENAFQL